MVVLDLLGELLGPLRDAGSLVQGLARGLGVPSLPKIAYARTTVEGGLEKLFGLSPRVKIPVIGWVGRANRLDLRDKGKPDLEVSLTPSGLGVEISIACLTDLQGARIEIFLRGKSITKPPEGPLRLAMVGIESAEPPRPFPARLAFGLETTLDEEVGTRGVLTLQAEGSTQPLEFLAAAFVGEATERSTADGTTIYVADPDKASTAVDAELSVRGRSKDPFSLSAPLRITVVSAGTPSRTTVEYSAPAELEVDLTARVARDAGKAIGLAVRRLPPLLTLEYGPAAPGKP